MTILRHVYRGHTVTINLDDDLIAQGRLVFESYVDEIEDLMMRNADLLGDQGNLQQEFEKRLREAATFKDQTARQHALELVLGDGRGSDPRDTITRARAFEAYLKGD